jgi:hypothetical protein
MNPGRFPEIKESRRLYFCQLMERHDGALELATTARRARQRLLWDLKDKAELCVVREGFDDPEAGTVARIKTQRQVAVVWSGRDCDGVRYRNDVWMVEATPAAVDEHIRHTYEWADGPCSYRIVSPTEAEALTYSSRDLALEAFEDGHAHLLIDAHE